MIYHLYSQRCFPLNLGDLTVNTKVVAVSQHSGCCRQSTHSLLEVVAVSQHKVEEVNKSLEVGDDGLLCCVLCLRDFGAAVQLWYLKIMKIISLEFGIVVSFYNLVLCLVWFGLANKLI